MSRLGRSYFTDLIEFRKEDIFVIIVHSREEFYSLGLCPGYAQGVLAEVLLENGFSLRTDLKDVLDYHLPGYKPFFMVVLAVSCHIFVSI